MAYRQIDTQIWAKSWFLDLQSDAKLILLTVWTCEWRQLGEWDNLAETLARLTRMPPASAWAGLDEIGRTAEGRRELRHLEGMLWSTNLDPGCDFDTHRAILERDARSCRYCGSPATHVDHVLPICQGGRSTPDNLVAACAHCNHVKGGRTPLQAGMVLR
jgi:hypothetical protein